MAIRIRTKRLATSATNPRKVSRRPRSPSKKRRKMTDKQIRHFGTKRQKAALKMKRSRRATNSHRTRTVKRSPNPAWIVTLGPSLNPKQRSSKMAQKKTKKRRKVSANRKTRRRVAKRNPVRRTRTRRTRKSNPKIVVRYRTRKANRKRRTVRRNPDLFGTRLGSKDSIKLIGGGLAGVAATKFLPTLLPATMLTGVANSNLGKTAISVAAALVAGFAATKLDARFGQGVYFGGLMQAASVGMNAFLPSIYKTLNIGMAGVGDFVPGQFAVPQNPVRQGIAAPSHMPTAAGSRVTMSGLARAYAPAY